jgi:hypothetical protein
MSKPTVFILYGLAEGPWHGKRFRQALDACGFESTNQAETADIIVAHSGGCFYLPPAKSGQLTVLINPPYWPGKPLLLSVWQTLWWPLRYYARPDSLAFWFKKTAWNGIYMLTRPHKAFWIAKHARQRQFYVALRQRRVVIIRSSRDPWLMPDASNLLKKHADFDYKPVPGEHDDCWLTPGPHIEVIKSVYDAR